MSTKPKTPSVQVSRRDAVLFSAFAPLLLACKGSRGLRDASARTLAAPSPKASGSPRSARACGATEASIEGPYYREGAPARADLTEQGMLGVPLQIEGRVTALDCTTPQANVELDFWQANHAGHYDNDGTLAPDRLLLRGKIWTDAEGRYRLKTIVPGRYLNGRQYRPSHVHVKLRAKSRPALTTQLYFPDDPYNDIDPFLHRSLIMDVKKTDRVVLARYDFVLP